MRLFCYHIGLLILYVTQGMTSSPPTIEVGKKYIDEFNEIFGTNYYIPVLFKDLKGSVVGECQTIQYSRHDFIIFRSIVIDPEAWFRYGDLTRRHLIYHEMAHCALNADHVDPSENEEFGCPKHIMSTKISPVYCMSPKKSKKMIESFIRSFKK